MRIYNVRIGLPIKGMNTKKSFISKNEALEYYLQYHPQSPKELNEKDTLMPNYKRIILNVI